MPNFSLGHRFENFIDEQVRSGRFENASEVVRAGLRLLEDNQRSVTERATGMKAAINAAFDDPNPDIPADDVFARINAQYARDVKAAARGA